MPVARRHIFLCCDQTKPKCCDRERGEEAWRFLKRRLKELGLAERAVFSARRPTAFASARVDRSPWSIRKAPGTGTAIRRCSSGSSANTSWKDAS